MSRSPTRSLRLFQFATLLLLSLGFWMLRSECLDAEDARRSCLSQLATPISTIVSFGTHILNHYSNYPHYETLVGCGALALVLLTLVFHRSCSWWSVLYMAAMGLAALGELSALRRNQTLTLLYHLGGCVAALGAFVVLLKREPESLSKGWIGATRQTVKVTLGEVLVVFIILATACINRFYQLNTNPAGYDAESCPHRMIADSWTKIMRQEVGEFVQQSSGLSWVAVHKLFTDVNHPSLFYLDERLMSVAMSLLGCAVMYFFMRSLQGPFAALLALILYVFGPLDLEWSRLPFIHHFPVIVSLLLAWATFSALNTRSWASFLAVALLMTCTKFVYPSAKMVILGPIAALCGIIFFRFREWRGHYLKLLCILAGLALFVGARSGIYYLVHGQFIFIAPFDNPYVSSVKISTLVRIEQMLTEGLYFFYEVFYAPVNPTHWTNHATVHPVRSVSSIIVVFLGLAFTRLLFLFRRPEALVFIGMMVGGLLPGMATGLADRRIAVSLTLCLVLGVLELTWFLNMIAARGSRLLTGTLKCAIPVCLFVCIGLLQTTAVFSRLNARPVQMENGDTVLSMVRDNTLVMYLAEERRCEIFYSLYNKMLDPERKIAFGNLHESYKTAEEQILAPAPILDSWYYNQTALAPQIDTLRKTKQWQHYLFVFQPLAERDEWRKLLKERYPHGKETVIDYPGLPGQRMLLYEVDNTQQPIPK